MAFYNNVPFVERMDNLSERYFGLPRWQRALLTLLGLLLPALLFVWFSFLPNNARLHQLKTDHKVLSAQIELLKRKASQADETEQLARQVESAFNTAMQALPSSGEIPSLLAGISNAGKTAGLDFLLFEPQPETQLNFYSEIPIQISVMGSFGGMGRFFEAVARLPRVVNIDTIAMAPDPTSSRLKADCRVVTYKFDENSAQKPSQEPAS
jgi:type IV pilus assembly protein PilO